MRSNHSASVRQRCQGRSGSRFAEIYREYRQDIYRYLYSRTRDDDLAEELTAETFARALARYDKYVPQAPTVRPWLYTIARNLLRDEVKSARWRLQAPAAEFVGATALPPAPDPAELVAAASVRRQLLGCVADLSDEQARCITLRFFEERSVRETSVAMRRSTGAVRALQNRGMTKLRELVRGTLAPSTVGGQ